MEQNISLDLNSKSDGSHTCPRCGRSYQNQATLNRHFRSHFLGYSKQIRRVENSSSEGATCSVCGKHYALKDSLKRHMQTHNTSLKYYCQGCRTMFVTYSQMYKHRMNCKIYKGSQEIKNLAEKTTPWIETTEEYLTVYKHKCQMCDARFALREQLDDHVNHCGDPFVFPNIIEKIPENASVSSLLKKERQKLKLVEQRKKLIVQVAKKVSKWTRVKQNSKVKTCAGINQILKIKQVFPETSARIMAKLKVKRYTALVRRKYSAELLVQFRKTKKWTLRKKTQFRHSLHRNHSYKCLCGRIFYNLVTVVKHLLVYHRIEKPLICGLCFKDFGCVTNFRFHQYRHENRTDTENVILRYTTIVCKRITTKRHRAETVSNDRVDLCKSNSSHNKDESLHVVKIISMCNVKKRKRNYYTNKILAGNLESKCLCGKIFMKRKILAHHVQSEHNLIMGYKCTHCAGSNAFNTFKDLYTHIQYKHCSINIQQSDFEQMFLIPLVPKKEITADKTMLEVEGKYENTCRKSPLPVKKNMPDPEKKIPISALRNTEQRKPKSVVNDINIISAAKDEAKKALKNEKNNSDLTQNNPLKNKHVTPAKKSGCHSNKLKQKYQINSKEFRANLIVRKYKTLLEGKNKVAHKQSERQHGERKLKKQKRALLCEQSLHQKCRYKCSFCQQIFKDAHNVISHLSVAHKEHRVLECGICKKTFSVWVNMNIHLFQHNKLSKQTTFSILYTTPVLPGLKDKMLDKETVKLTHGKGDNKCQMCGKVFLQRIKLDQHLKTSHKMVLGYRCKLCNERQFFASFERFSEHLGATHNKIIIAENDFEQLYVKLYAIKKDAQSSYPKPVYSIPPGTQSMGSTKPNLIKIRTLTRPSQKDHEFTHLGQNSSKPRVITKSAESAHASRSEVDSEFYEKKEKQMKSPVPKIGRKETGKRKLKIKFDSDYDYSGGLTFLTKKRKLCETDMSKSDIVYSASDEMSVSGVKRQHITANTKPDKVARSCPKSRDDSCCKYCGKKFNYKIQLQKHIEKLHSRDNEKMFRERNTKTKEVANVEANLEPNCCTKELRVLLEDISELVNDKSLSVENLDFTERKKCCKTMKDDKMSAVVVQNDQSDTGIRDNEIKNAFNDSSTNLKLYRELPQTKTLSHLEMVEEGGFVFFECTVKNCNKVFSTKKKLRYHKKESHRKALVYICSVCFREYMNIRSVKIHVNNSHSDVKTVPLKIEETEFYINNDHNTFQSPLKTEAIEFYIKNEQPTQILVCTTCGTIGNDKVLLSHTCQPKGLKYYCPFCNMKRYTTVFEEIRDHIKCKHPDAIESAKERSSHTDADEEILSTDKQNAGEKNSPDSTSDVADGEVGKFICTHTNCNRSFATAVEEKIHKHEHIGEKQQAFVCGLCGKSYPRHNALKKHMMVHLKNQYKCQFCERDFQEESDLLRHVNTHTGNRPYQCDICGNRYCDDQACKRHIKEKHPDIYVERYGDIRKRSQGKEERSFFCELCGIMLSNYLLWTRHITSKHHGKKGLQCSICGDSSFKSNKALEVHMQEHKHAQLLLKAKGVQELPELADAVELDPNLELHNKVTELAKDPYAFKEVYQHARMFDKFDTTGMPYTCKICSKKFKKVKYLNLHIRVTHTNDKDKKFQCKICGRGFPLMNSFRNHFRIHTNSRPYKCKLCPKTFKQLGHVKDHLFSHSSKFIDTCRICGKEYKRNGSLKLHILTHCKLQPFKCPICSDTFQDLSQLTAHFSRYTSGNELEDKTKTYTCHMCLNFTSESKADILQHLNNHKLDKPFTCPKCDERFPKFLTLYFHKVKFNHFIESDFETKKFHNSYLTNNNKTVLFDDYSLEELQAQYQYEPDDPEFLREMVNTEMKEANDETEYFYLKEVEKLRKPVAAESTDVARNMNDTDFECRDINTAGFSQTATDLEYEDDLLSVAQQLTQMADISHGEYSEIVVPDSLEDDTLSIVSDGRKQLGLNVETSSDVVVQAGQFENSFDVSSHWNTELILKGQGQENLTQQNSQQYAGFQKHIGPNMMQENVSRYQENVSAANALLQENNMKSVLPQNTEFIYDEKDTSAGQSIRPDTAANSFVQQTYKVVDQTGNELIVCILNENVNKTDIHNVLQNETFQKIVSFQQRYNGVSEKETDIADKTRETVFEKRRESVPQQTDKVIHAVMNENKNLEIPEITVTEKNNKETSLSTAKAPEHNFQGPDTAAEHNLLGVDTAAEVREQVAKHVESENILTHKTKYMHKKNEDTGDYPCDICGKRFIKKKLRSVHRKVHLSDSERAYKCDQCGRGFNRPSNLEHHKMVHTGEKLFSCQHCDKRFTQLGHLKTHCRIHDNYRPFRCDKCDWSCITKSLLRKHVLTKHEGVRKWKCDKCDLAYITKSELMRHHIVHMSKMEKSELIVATSQMDEDFVESNAKVENKIPKFICDICGKGYMQESTLNLHYMKHETGEDFKCEVCSKGFPTAKLLTEHEKCHKNTEMPCDRCGKILKNRQSLRHHISSVHASRSKVVINYRCAKCDKGFNKRKHFLCHVAVCQAEIIEKKVYTVESQ